MEPAERIPLTQLSEADSIEYLEAAERIPLIALSEAQEMEVSEPAEFIGCQTKISQLLIENPVRIGLLQYKFELRSKYKLKFVLISAKVPFLNLNEIAFAGDPVTASYETIYASSSSITNLGPSILFQSQFDFVVQGLLSDGLRIRAFDVLGNLLDHTIP